MLLSEWRNLCGVYLLRWTGEMEHLYAPMGARGCMLLQQTKN